MQKWSCSQALKIKDQLAGGGQRAKRRESGGGGGEGDGGDPHDFCGAWKGHSCKRQGALTCSTFQELQE